METTEINSESHPKRRSTDKEEEIISEQEFCKRLIISPAYAFQLRKAGRLPHYRVGKRVLYGWPNHARQFLDAHERKQRIA
jgi:hypothetical protein